MEENIVNLNKFLSELEIMVVKLQNYHWNVQGSDFFIIHSKLEELHDELKIQIDEVAEHILAKGFEPLGTMKDFLSNSEIVEAKNEKIKSDDLLKIVAQDYMTLYKKALKIKEIAENTSDYETSSLIDDYLRDYSKKLWMLNEAIK